MSTRRDTELTSPEQRQMFEQLRGLYRHVPFTARDFANLAPNVALTLNRDNPEEALPILWDILDRQEPSDHLDALLVLLGMRGHQGLNVLHRKSAFNADVHPRTVSRRADTALTGLVRYIDEQFKTAFAFVVAMPYSSANTVYCEFAFHSNVDMEAVSLRVDEDYQELSIPDQPSFEHRYEFTATGVTEYRVQWPGPVYPIFEVSTAGSELYRVSVAQSFMLLMVRPRSEV